MNGFSLSPQQKRAWLLKKGTKDLFTKVCVEVRGQFSFDAFLTSLRSVERRNEILRTSYIVDDNLFFPLQKVEEGNEMEVVLEEISSLPSGEQAHHIDKVYHEYAESDVMKPACHVIKTGEANHYLLFRFPVLSMDLCSFQELLEQIDAEYHRPSEKKEHEDQEGALSYIHYSEWQNENLRCIEEDGIDHWKDTGLEDAQSSVPQTLNRHQQTDGPGNTKILEYKVEKDTLQGIRELALALNVSVEELLFTCWNVVLGFYSGKSAFLSGWVCYDKGHELLKDTLGLFGKALPINYFTKPDASFASAVSSLQTTRNEASEFKDYFILGSDKGDFDISQSPDFIPCLFEYFDQGFSSAGGWELTIKASHNPIEKSDLMLSVISHGDSDMVFSFQYDESVLHSRDIDQIAGSIQHLLVQAIHSPNQKLSAFAMLSEPDQEKVIAQFNEASVTVPESDVVSVFEQVCSQYPDRESVVFEGRSMTFGELNQRANRLAHLLQHRYDITSGEIVGVALERSDRFIVAVLAILKLGGAYLPINPEYPEERIRLLVSDSGIRHMLTESDASYSLEGVNVIKDFEDSQFSGENPGISLSPDQPAYVIYTSGSTGRPKGVIIKHRSLVNLTHIFLNKVYGTEQAYRFALVTPFAFDASVEQIFSALLGGHALHIISDTVRKDPYQLFDYLDKQVIEIIDFTPALFAVTLEAIGNRFSALPLKHVIIAGDMWSPKLISDFYKFRLHQGACQYYNIYGPTECTVNSTIFPVPHDRELSVLPIGKPLPNTRVYILNDQLQPVPVGCAGKMYIAGAGVASGYLNNDTLTAQKFIADPFTGQGMMYDTGDLGKWLYNGEVEFLGREDEQVKVRGYRIELGEIDHFLLQHDQVAEAVTLAKSMEDGSKRLITYVKPIAEVPANHLSDYLGKLLPDYMVPGTFIFVDRFPLNTNGKVDRRALLKMEVKDLSDKEKSLPPRNEIEKLLAKAWQEVLEMESPGIRDNFFENGGDSIKAIQLASKMYKAGYKLEIKDIFDNPFIEEMGLKVKGLKVEIDQSTVVGEVPLTPIQRAFLHTSKTDLGHFNQAVMLFSSDGFDEDIVKSIFGKITEHHDILRSRLLHTEAGYKLINEGLDYPVEVQVFDLTSENNPTEQRTAYANKLHAGIDIEKGPMVKLAVFKEQDGDRLLIIIHHLVTDGVSWRILLEDVGILYEQYIKGEPLKLPPKTHSFKFWAENLEQYANSEKAEKLLAQWVTDEPHGAESILPAGASDTNLVADRDYVEFQLNAKTTEELTKEAPVRLNSELNELLLTALVRAVHQEFNMSNVGIMLEGHGRENIIEDIDISRTIGWFTSEYPVYFDVSPDGETMQQVIEVKNTLRRIKNKGIDYGILKYLGNKGQALALQQEPEISFNFLGQFSSSILRTPFEIADEATGEEISPLRNRKYLLEINGLIRGGKLEMTIIYNKNHFDKAAMTALGQTFETFIQELATYVPHEDKEATPGDFEYNELSQSELDSLFN